MSSKRKRIATTEVPQSEEQKDVKKRVRWCTNRCFSGKLHRMFKGLSDLLTQEQSNLLMQTKLGHFVNIPDISISMMYIEQILQRWNKEKRGLQLGDEFVSPTISEVAVMLGIPGVGKKVVWMTDDKIVSKSFDEICNGNITQFDSEKLKERLIELAGRPGRDNAIKFVQLYLALVFGLFLFPSTNARPPSGMFKYIDDPSTICTYNWAAAVHFHLLRGLDHASDEIRKGKQGDIYVQGCTAFLMVSLCLFYILANMIVFECCSVIIMKTCNVELFI